MTRVISVRKGCMETVARQYDLLQEDEVKLTTLPLQAHLRVGTFRHPMHLKARPVPMCPARPAHIAPRVIFSHIPLMRLRSCCPALTPCMWGCLWEVFKVQRSVV